MSATPAAAHYRPLPGESPRLAVPRQTQHGIGKVILAAQSADLIADVEIVEGKLWPDDRGFFTELFRLGGEEAWARGFTPRAQVSAALSYPGTIKAVHYHRRQTDLWTPVRGQLQVVLFDLRLESSTFGRVNTIYAGEWRPWRLRIPPGVGHGYKVVSTEPALMIYATDRFYDPDDEGRIPYNDPDLNYDWELQHK